MDEKRFTKMKHDRLFLKRALWEVYNKKCIYCGMELMYKEVEIDHLWPSSEGNGFCDKDMIAFKKELESRGFETETLENYVISCKDCNGRAKKSNNSLGVSNLRFYYSVTFKKSNRVRKLIEKYEREMADELVEVKEHNKNDGMRFDSMKLLIPKRVTNTFDSSYFVWGKGHACIRAFIHWDYKKEISCCISTEELSKSNISYTLSQKDMKSFLFAGSGTAIEKRPWCVKYSPEEGRKDYCIALPNIRIEATYEEVKELSEIIDDLFEEFMLQQSRIRDILGINSFESNSMDEVPILNIPKELWKDIINFSRQHFCNKENTEWNIFNVNYSDRRIQLCLNDNVEKRSNGTYFVAGVLVQFVAKESKEDSEVIYWVPGYGALEKSKMDNFDNEFKWKADYAHDWFLYKLIPVVLFSKLSFGKKMRYKRYTNKEFIRDYIIHNRYIVSYKQEVEE